MDGLGGKSEIRASTNYAQVYEIDGTSLFLSKVENKGQINPTDKHNQDFSAFAIAIFKHNCKNVVSG